MVIWLVDEWATHFHFEGITLYFLNYHLTIFQAKWSKVKGARGWLWQSLFKKFEGPFFPCTLPRPKSSSTQIKTHVYLLHILFLLLLHGPQSEGNWERAEWPTPKRVRGLCDPAPTSAPSVRNPLWLSCGCRPKWMHIPCYKPWLNKKNLIVVSLKWDSSFLPLGKILLL